MWNTPIMYELPLRLFKTPSVSTRRQFNRRGSYGKDTHPPSQRSSGCSVAKDENKLRDVNDGSFRVLIQSWRAEIIAWTLAAMALGIICVLVVVFRDKRLSEWQARITINTLVNFGSQFTQTALLIPVASSISQLKWLWYRETRPLKDMDNFDDASRQPLDALLLSFRHPKR